MRVFARQIGARFAGPPGERFEKIHQAPVAVEHDHGIVAAAVDPSPARVRARAGPAIGAFAGRLVATRDRYFPGKTAARVGIARGRTAVFAPAGWIMILVTVL